MKSGFVTIAHRGASGYLPEHTLAAKALAYGQGADFLEQDLVATRDDRLIVSHDIHLDRVTDVATQFPGRAREDGRYYARDLDLEEIQSLTVTERITAEGAAVFPDRFPINTGQFRVNTFEEELTMLRGLNAASDRRVGIYPEIKAPAWHHAEGVDLAALTLGILDDFGYRRRDDEVFVQCFDWRETQRIRRDLKSNLKLVQLIADPSWNESSSDYESMLTEDGLREVAAVADGIGPWLNQLYELEPIDGCPVSSGVVARAHAAGLLVHPYTFRADALPAGFEDFDALLRFFIDELAIDGLFTDFPDLAAVFTRLHPEAAPAKM
ncbi:MAG: glycerophosphodiester phosphodiesterase [Pseudomonadota bacterium]